MRKKLIYKVHGAFNFNLFEVGHSKDAGNLFYVIYHVLQGRNAVFRKKSNSSIPVIQLIFQDFTLINTSANKKMDMIICKYKITFKELDNSFFLNYCLNQKFLGQGNGNFLFTTSFTHPSSFSCM